MASQTASLQKLTLNIAEVKFVFVFVLLVFFHGNNS